MVDNSTLVLLGGGFDSGVGDKGNRTPVVTIGGVACPVTFWDANRVECNVPCFAGRARLLLQVPDRGHVLYSVLWYYITSHGTALYCIGPHTAILPTTLRLHYNTAILYNYTTQVPGRGYALPASASFGTVAMPANVSSAEAVGSPAADTFAISAAGRAHGRK